MDSFEELLEDLGGEVKILSHAPVFNGTYSRVYRGRIRRSGELVCLFEVLITAPRTENINRSQSRFSTQSTVLHSLRC
jgi:uncharacterized protein with von Willebrand factor type A (vWA) domain